MFRCLLAEGSEAVEKIISVLPDEGVDKNAISRFLEEIPDKAQSLLIRVVIAVVVSFILLRVIKLLVRILRRAMTRAKASPEVTNFFCSFLNIALKVLLLFGILAAFGVSTASIIAILGSAGLAIGLALQGSLSNLAGGVMILILKPFKIGDYIQEDSHGHEGIVHEVGLFNTKLRSYDNKLIILPNGDLANTSLTNMTGNTERLLEIKVGVAYDTDLLYCKQVLEKFLADWPAKITTQPTFVYVDSLGDSAVVMGVRCWVATYDYLKLKWELNERIKLTLDEAGIEIPFTQVDVHMRNGSGEMDK